MIDTYFANIWVTHTCNYRCRYCYARHLLSSANMTNSVADSIVRFIADTIEPHQKLIVNFHGGEPTLNLAVIQYIVHRVAVCVSNEVSYGITTNGSTLNDEIITYLANNFTFNLSVSIDGDEKTQGYNRIPIVKVPTFGELITNVSVLNEKTNRLRVRMTFDPLNTKDIFSNIVFMINKGFKNICISPDIYNQSWSENDFSEIFIQLKLVNQYITEKKIIGVYISEIDKKFLPVRMKKRVMDS